MTRDELNEIFEDDSGIDWEEDNALTGLTILAKYHPKKTVLCGADHDIIYSVDVDETLANGLTKEDATILRDINWMIQDDYFACFV